MKKLIATICIIGSAAALSACSTSNTSSAPYAQERTAGAVGQPAAVERTFNQRQAK